MWVDPADAAAAQRRLWSADEASLTAMVPCYNEEACVERAYREIADQLQGFEDCEILFVDDGSTDGTLELIKSFARSDKRVKYISFSRNFGLEAAFSAGFRYAGKQWTVQLDADLQSPPHELHKLLDKALEGYDIVFGVRVDRRDPWVRRIGSQGNAAIAGRLLGIALPPRASVFRVARTSVARRIVTMDLRSPYFIATAPLIGARLASVPTAHQPRAAGLPKWNMARLVSHVSDLWIGFSTRPLRAVSWCAALLAVVSLVMVVLLAAGAVGATGIAVTALAVDTATLLGLGVLLLYAVPVLRVRARMPQYLVRESNIAIDPADDLYGSDRRQEASVVA